MVRWRAYRVGTGWGFRLGRNSVYLCKWPWSVLHPLWDSVPLTTSPTSPRRKDNKEIIDLKALLERTSLMEQKTTI